MHNYSSPIPASGYYPMSDVAIRIENLSKQYRLGRVGTGTLGHDLNRWWHYIRGKEDPYLKIGEVNDRAHRGKSEYVWALRDINFEVKQGEVLGIIGKNGSGKSTLLKILSKVTGPTTGRVMARGRIASLLEVGTGFHPELTGRENIFLNGAILGMTKQDVARKLDEIVEFAGVERYLDTPVKRYSSGMTVRLGFAVAAFLEEEILIVDEVLAVGDAEFQKKAIGKMQEVSKMGGRTVLFVSHSMNSIQQLCPRAILLENGNIKKAGISPEVIQFYSEQSVGISLTPQYKGRHYPGHGETTELIEAKIVVDQAFPTSKIKFGQPFGIYIKTWNEKNIPSLALSTRVFDKNMRLVFVTNTLGKEELHIAKSGFHEVVCSVPNNCLVPGKYYISIGAYIRPHTTVFQNDHCLSFEVLTIPIDNSFIFNAVGSPLIALKTNWYLDEPHISNKEK